LPYSLSILYHCFERFYVPILYRTNRHLYPTKYSNMETTNTFLSAQTNQGTKTLAFHSPIKSLLARLMLPLFAVMFLAGSVAGQTYTVCSGEAYLGDLAAYDDYGSTTPPIFSLLTGPGSGTLLLNEDGSFSYTGNEAGTYTFTYQVDATTGNLIVPGAECTHAQTIQVVYLGTGADIVVVSSKITQGQGQPVEPSIFAEFENVQHGETLTIVKDHDGAPGLGLNWDFEVDGEIVVSINTACGINLLGKTFGDFLVVGVDDYTLESLEPEVVSHTATATLVVVLPDAEITPDGDLEFCEGGEVTLTVSESDAYLWSNGESTRSITVSESGTFTVTVTDANGCSATSDEVTVTVHELPEIILPDFGPVCEDADAFDLIGETPTGGTYSGTGFQGGQFVPSVAGHGTHTITYTYTDENGCTNTATVDIVVNELPEVTLAAIAPICEDATAFALTGGSPAGGTYFIDGTEASTFDPAAEGAGTYEISYVYTDENGCTESASTNVTVNALPVVTCPEGMNVYENDEPFALTGAAPAGGTYYIDEVAITTFDPAVAGIGSHLITYVYVDGNGCESFCEFNINVNEPPLTPFCELQDDSFTACEGETLNGDVSDNDDYFSLGTAVFSQLTEPSSGTLVFNEDGSFSYVPGEPGTYTFDYQLTIVTSEGEIPTGDCAHVETMQVIYLGDGADVVVVTSKVTGGAGDPVNPSVYEVFTDVETGDELTITKAHGGAYGLGLNWEFEVDGTVVARMNTACGINLLGKTFGPFLVVGVDGYSLGDGAETETCTATVTLVVPGAGCPNDLAVCMEELPLTLGGATPAGGVYSGTGVSLENGTYMFDAATAGDYTITYSAVSDGCDVECSFTVTVYPQPNAEITPDGDLEFCEGGSVVLTAPTADAYLWSTDETTQSITVSESGTFSVTVTDDNGCTATSEGVTVTVNEIPVISLTGTDVLCYGDDSGEIAVTITGGSAPYEVSLDGETWIGVDGAAHVFENLLAGDYTVLVRDANGCMTGDDATIEEPAELVIDAGSDTEIFYGETFDMDASVTGNGPFTYAWTPAALVDDASALNPTTLALTETTTFTLTVTDANDCSTSDEVTITVTGEELTVEPAATPESICIDDSSQLLANADGGAGVLTYSWTSDPAGFESSDENPVVSPTTTTTYFLTVTDEMETSVSGSVTVTVNEIPEIACPEYGPLCVGSGEVLFTESGVFTYNGQVVTGIDPVTPGTYTFVYTYTSEAGCSASCEFDIVVEELPLLNCTGLSRVVCLSAGNFVLNGANPSGGVFSGDFVANNRFNTLQAGPGEHTVTYTITDLVTGCSNSCDFTVTVLGAAEYTLTKSLTAINGDASLTQFSEGDVITFSIVVENTGALDLENIEITDPGTTIVSGSPISSLAPGTSATVVATYEATEADVTAGSISNTASGTAISTYGTTGSTCGIVSATSNTVLVEAAPFGKLTVIKTADLQTYSFAGDVITYTIVVENSGNLTLQDVVVTDPMTGLETVIPALEPGRSERYTETIVVTPADLERGEIENTAYARGNGSGDKVFTGSDSARSAAVILTAELDMTKSADVSQVLVGEQITYTMVVSNNNPAPATNVVVTDELPAGVAFVSASHDGSYDEGTNTVTWNLGDLAADGSVSLTLVVEADLDLVSGTVLTNVAVVENDNADFPAESNPATVSVFATADLMILKGADVGSAYNNQEITYTLTVTNLGPSVAGNVVVHDLLPPQVEFVSASHGWSFNPNNKHVTWTLGNMNSQETIVLTVVTSVKADVAKGTSITNFSTVASETTDPNLDNNEANATITASGAMADLAVVKEVDVTEILAGVPFNYSIIVTNNGPSNVSNIGVVDYLPGEASFLSAGQNGTYNEASQTVNWIIDFLASGESVTLTLTMELRSGVVGGSIVANEVSVQSDTPDPDMDNNTHVIQTPVGIPTLFIPDVFTPNNDGINDKWVIRGLEAFPNNKVVIINRWGNRVFEASSYNNDWDGTNHYSPSMGGNVLPVGTYFYILDLGPNEPQRTGFIYLAR
jgi:uncharacterized repeat protein (TIGR01451 family)/gliding motility-associated-like protein